VARSASCGYPDEAVVPPPEPAVDLMQGRLAVTKRKNTWKILEDCWRLVSLTYITDDHICITYHTNVYHVCITSIPVLILVRSLKRLKGLLDSLATDSRTGALRLTPRRFWALSGCGLKKT
jgi:hypothetical protein